MRVDQPDVLSPSSVQDAETSRSGEPAQGELVLVSSTSTPLAATAEVVTTSVVVIEDPVPVRVGSRRTPVVASALTLISLAAVAFLVNLTLISSVEHARSQRLGYADLRANLSAVTAPTGQVGQDGRLLALGTPLGYLSAPALGLSREVFFEGTTASVLAKGPGHRRSTLLPGQAGISVLYARAWAYGGPFGSLASVPAGSILTVTTGQGEHTYRVKGVRRAGDLVPAAPDVSKGQGRLTLVSAEGSLFVPTGTIYLDADLVSKAQPSSPRVLSAAGLLPSEQPLASDSSAWPSVFLLLQGLALSALGVTYAARRFGGPVAWLTGVPVLTLFAVLASRELVRLLPNLL